MCCKQVPSHKAFIVNSSSSLVGSVYSDKLGTMSSPTLPRRKLILVSGNWQTEEQQGVRAFLEERRRQDDAVARLVEFPTKLPSHEIVSVVIVCLSHPDEFSAATIRRLWDDYPLSQIVCSAGAWCDSDPRTRGLWPSAWRVSATEVHRHLEILWSDERRPPMTASREELFLANAAERRTPILGTN